MRDALARVRLDVDPRRAVGELGASLSGGEERRLALSRLVVGDYQILVLDDGKLVGLGKHAELLASCPVYEEIYASQFKKGDAQK